jgi:eukaryotic-like serine/threonine-protein kinase
LLIDRSLVEAALPGYQVEGDLGKGGYGLVLAGQHRLIGRKVAIKILLDTSDDPELRTRFLAEARVLAELDHPHIVRVHDYVEHEGTCLLVMELLSGGTLKQRIQGAKINQETVCAVGIAAAAALSTAHAAGVLHRDIKPDNIMFDGSGLLKVTDFGIAKIFDGAETTASAILGTPRYMAPEQIEGGSVDLRSDLFSLGMVLYEMVAGRPPFGGESVFEVAAAILHDEPPALGGSSSIVALDRIIQRALRKQPDARYQTAAVFAQELRSAMLVTDSGEKASVRPMTRLVVLPFRVLRPDPSIDFLAFSLADAISSALSGLPSLVVRSTAAAAGFATAAPDFPALARALDVDVVLIGTLLSSGEQVRVSAHLVQVPSGTLVRAITSQATSGEIFQLQDGLAQSIVESLSLSLTPREQGRINRDVPASPEAYEWYLRANEMQLDSKQWLAARDLYRRCVERDPQFAPAWARLGRCYRLLGKFGDRAGADANLASGEQALKRALAINPDLSLAHNLYAHVEVEAGRAREAMVRLLERIRTTPSEPELFAGLVHACRYCGLLDASEAAYERARRLDPRVVTSVAHTFLQKHDWDRAVAADMSDPPIARIMALVLGGRRSEGIELLRAAVAKGLPPALHGLLEGMLAFFQGDHDQLIASIHWMLESDVGDPEAFYHWAGALAQTGDDDGALGLLERCINAGYSPALALVTDPRFDSVRGLADFRSLARRAEELHKEALETFRAADGPRLLGLPQV